MKRLKSTLFLMGALALDLAAAQPAGRQLVPALDAAKACLQTLTPFFSEVYQSRAVSVAAFTTAVNCCWRTTT